MAESPGRFCSTTGVCDAGAGAAAAGAGWRCRCSSCASHFAALQLQRELAVVGIAGIVVHAGDLERPEWEFHHWRGRLVSTIPSRTPCGWNMVAVTEVTPATLRAAA